MFPFESFANSKRYKTAYSCGRWNPCLRALLIQKDTKPNKRGCKRRAGLRALLIQKDTKPDALVILGLMSLRALLIQKDTKPAY